ncbi:MAG: thioredoxin family protein [Desulfurivibrio sp.]|nr:thioredoxin family protein [Desulfurivibrio sp.]
MSEQDIPLPNSLKIGRATVGLLELDVALSRALAAPQRPEAEVVDELYQRVAARNYIPPGLEDEYRRALAREYRRLLAGEARQDEDLQIRILGADCVSCNRLQEDVLAVMAKRGIAADIVKITDPDQIARYGLQRTPALVVDGEVVCAGRLPSPAEVEGWLCAGR